MNFKISNIPGNSVYINIPIVHGLTAKGRKRNLQKIAEFRKA